MSRYRRPDRLDDPGPLLGKLRVVRDELIRASSTVKPSGVVDHALQMVLVAIDGLATVLTGERYYFMVLGTTAPEGQRAAEEEKRRRERL